MCMKSSSGDSEESMESAKSVAVDILEKLENFPFLNDDFKIQTFTNALPEIALLSHASVSRCEYQDLNKTLIKKISFVVFNPKTKPYEGLLILFDETLGENEETAKPSADFVNFFKALQDLIHKEEYICNDVPSDVASGAFLRNLLCEVLNQNKPGLEPFKVFALLCAVAGADIPLLVTADSCCKDFLKDQGVGKSLNIVVLCSLLKACADYPQCFIGASVPEGHMMPSDWLNGIEAILMDSKFTKNKSCFLKCFRYLTKISVPVIENNVVSVIKLCLLSINVKSQESKEEYCKLFKELLSLYSKLHQLPKFFVKLLRALTECIKENSAGKCVLRGQVYPDILESFALFIQELPFVQKIELWKYFSEFYTTFVNMSQLFQAGKGVALYIAQFFSTFLFNSRIFSDTIPDNAVSEFGEKIQHTTSEMKNNCYILTHSNEAHLAKQSFLLLCYALGEIELRSTADERYHHRSFELKSPNDPFDCSLLLNFLDENHTNIFDYFLKCEDKPISFLVYLLILQKIRGLVHKGELLDTETTHLQKSVSALLHYAMDSLHSNGAWDLDLCTLSENNYGSAVWRMLLKCLPLILNFIEIKELILVCSCFRQIVVQESLCEGSSGKDLKSIVLSELQNPSFQTSKVFQSAFTASLWKVDLDSLVMKRSFNEMDSGNSFYTVLLALSVYKAKWIKYAESTPKDNDGHLNSMWENLKLACDSLNQIISSDATVKVQLKSELYTIVELTECLDVEFLLPGNQLRCLIGLSVLLFLSPESCKSEEVLGIMERISKLIVAILEGIRSVWLFDFVSSGDYLQQVVSTIERIMEKNPSEPVYDWCKVLLNSLITLITLNTQNLSTAENYFSQSFNEKQMSSTFVLTLSLMLEKLSPILKRPILKPEFKEVCERLSVTLCCCCVKFLKKYDGSSKDYAFTLLVQCYTEVIELITLPTPFIDEKKKTKCLAQLPKLLKTARECSWNQKSNQQVYLNLFSKVLKHLPDLENLIPEGFHVEIWEIIKLKYNSNDFSNEGFDNQLFSSESEIELLQNVFSLFTEERINAIFHEILLEVNDTEIDQLNTNKLKTTLIVLQQVIESDYKRENPFLSLASLQNLIQKLHIIVSLADESELHLKKLKIPVLEFSNFLLKMKKGPISRLSLFQILHFCQGIQLQNITDLPNYTQAFQAIWNIVYNLLVNHAVVVLSSPTTFLWETTKLLKSIVLAGTQDAMSASNSETQSQMISCARDIDRLFTMISRQDKVFSKLVPKLIATYVDSVQHVTLEANIKAHLLSGLNRLFDICSEESLKTIAVNISHSCRDIYTNIVKNYRQYQYQGGN